ncbi:Oligosaccharyltransferase complex subunit ostc-A, partial [Trichinella pseudospiralis]
LSLLLQSVIFHNFVYAFLISNRFPVCRLTKSISVVMDTLVDIFYFSFLQCPNLRLKLPRWVQMPSAMVVYALVLLSYFFVTGGVIYDIIIEPPSIGSTVDAKGHSRPVAFLPHRVNGQYIMEGLAASFMFVLGGIGFVVIHRANLPSVTKGNRSMLLFFGIGCILISYIACTTFIRIKLPQF